LLTDQRPKYKKSVLILLCSINKGNMRYSSSSLFLAILFGTTLISGLLLASSIDIDYAQASTSGDNSNSPVTVNKALYQSAETIVVTGKSDPNQNLEIQVINPNGAIYRTVDVGTSSAGNFEYEFKLGGKLAIAGIFMVAVRSGTGLEGSTTFEFVPEGWVAEEFMIDGKPYHIRIMADEHPDWLQEISPDYQSRSLILHLTNEQGEALKMELDRSVIATNPGECFVVQADGNPVDVRCSSVDHDTTMITLTIPPQTRELQIMGTSLVPEFGNFLLPIVVIAAISASIIATSKFRK